MLDDEIKNSVLDYQKKVNQVRENFRNYQKEVEIRFVEEQKMISEKATFDDIAVIRGDI